MTRTALFYFLAISLSVCWAEDVFSCGGFVKSPVPISFSKVMVKLYSRDMHLKYETDCAPNNGYYMIPVYAKGSYVVKVHPPNGWNFEPSQTDLTVDGLDDPCTKGVDLNFNFLGFSVSGQVLSKGSDAGPADFAIALTKEGDKEPMVVAKTVNGGRYEFKGVLPGSYYITNIDSSMCVEKKQTTIPVQVAGPTTAPPLNIEGYSIRGSVKSDSQAVAGAEVLLYGEAMTKLSGCESTPLKDFNLPAAAAGLHFICRRPSSANGEYKFACAPSGNYMLVPYYKSGGVTFDLSPKSVKVSVSHGAVQVKEPFQVVGFTIPGRVLWQNKGQGVHGVEIFVNGKFTSQTNQNGDYLLERMSAGKYQITAKREGVEFTSVEVDLSPQNHLIPEIIATAFQICGSVVLHSVPSSVPKLTQRKLLLTNVGTKEVFSLTTDQDGSFCRMVQRGSYLLEPQVLPNEKQAGVVLVPKERKIVIADKPISGLGFSQFEAKIVGMINCIGTCKQVKVQLLAGNSEVSSIHFPTVDKKETFHFTHLLPGAYVVKLQTDYYCWENQELRVDIDQADVTDLQFRQTGFLFSIISTHKAKLTFSLQGSSAVRGAVDLPDGKYSFCLPQAGTYEMKLESCHRFEPAAIKHNTDNPGVVSVTAVEHAVTGSVVTDGPLKDAHVNVNDNQGSLVKQIGPLTKGTNSTGRWVYEFEYWAKTDDEFVFEPTSKSYLFTPEKYPMKVEADCRLNAVKFIGSEGLFLKCRVEPALKEVTITMKEKDGEKIKFVASTDHNGECSLGPLRSFDGYTVSAAMQGYSFEAIAGELCKFKSFKLSELVIKAVDSNKTPLPGVLISLSGTDYRSNNLTDDTGMMTFFGLTPGEYFLRPVLKEFTFQPATSLVKIAEGSAQTIEVVGKRVAYSCSGALRYLAGQPVAGAVLEAVSSGCNHVQEEAITGEDGSFRIRGLLPGCDYVLRMRDGQDFPATFPRQLSIKVVLFKGDAPSPVHSVHLQGSVFFLPSVNMDNSTYMARLESTLNAAEYENIKFPEVTFKANNTSKFITFDFKPKRKSPEAEISKGSYIALPLAIALVLIAYNYETLLPVAKEWINDVAAFVNFQQLQANKSNPAASGAFDTGASDFEGSAEGAAGAKRKIRARKT